MRMILISMSNHKTCIFVILSGPLPQPTLGSPLQSEQGCSSNLGEVSPKAAGCSVAGQAGSESANDNLQRRLSSRRVLCVRRPHIQAAPFAREVSVTRL